MRIYYWPLRQKAQENTDNIGKVDFTMLHTKQKCQLYFMYWIIKIDKQEFVDQFYVIKEMGQKMILGVPWLQQHDPSVSFKRRQIEIFRRGKVIRRQSMIF